ncbi:MAG: alkyl hydroperoxide reductase [Fimbriimonas sp.]
MPDPLTGYRRWFMAAAVYNAFWGIVVSAIPATFVRLGGLEPGTSTVLVQVIGMMVGVYAYAYYLLAKDPLRYQGVVWVGLAGKMFGPLGFLVSAIRGDLPWQFGLVVLTNDLIWWPAFWGFALKYARRPLEPVVPKE